MSVVEEIITIPNSHSQIKFIQGWGKVINFKKNTMLGNKYEPYKEVKKNTGHLNSVYIDENRKNLKFTFRDEAGSGSIS